MSEERVQKILAQAGIASRRKAEELIIEGEVTINGRVAKLGDKAVLGRDAIKVRGKLLQGVETPVYYAFYKPKGVISALSDPEGRATLSDFLGRVKARVYPIGRLDFNSEGLILLTNDGAFAEKLQRREDIPRVYHVKVKGHPEAAALERVARGGRVGERFLKPYSVSIAEELANKSFVRVVLLGHGAADVKTLFESKGLLVEKMVRVAIGHLSVKGLAPGQLRVLQRSQVEALLNQPELGMRALEQAEEKATDLQPEWEPKPERGHLRERRDDRPKVGFGATSRRKPTSRSKPSRGPSGTPFAGGGRTRAPRGKPRRGPRD